MAVLYRLSYDSPSAAEPGIARLAVPVNRLNYLTQQRWRQRGGKKRYSKECVPLCGVCEQGRRKTERNDLLFFGVFLCAGQ